MNKTLKSQEIKLLFSCFEGGYWRFQVNFLDISVDFTDCNINTRVSTARLTHSIVLCQDERPIRSRYFEIIVANFVL